MDRDAIIEIVKAALQPRGYTLHIKARRAREYAYAARRIGTRTEDKYLAALNDLPAIMACIETLPNGSTLNVGQQPTAAPSDHQTETPDNDRTRLLSELLELGRLMDYDSLVLGARSPDDAIVIRPGMRSWATYGAGLDATRLKAVVFHARRYYNHLRSVGLAKGPEPTAPELQPSTPAPAPVIQDRQQDSQAPDDLDSLGVYTRETLKHQGPHDQARRAWLKRWAQGRGYATFWFTVHDKYSGYHQTSIPAGPENWANFLERAVQFDVYCCFVAALGRNDLKYYLEDAEKRGQIRLDYMSLVWKASNHKTPR
jgi:hypothetical protein